MRLVYYSLSPDADGISYPYRHTQLSRSVRSLREHNQRIRVVVFAFGGLPPALRRDLERHGVEIRWAGDYRERLRQLFPAFCEPLARYPTLHRWLALRELASEKAERCLYLDCDTYFLGDVDRLFRKYSKHDWYAREEPFSRRSAHGYDPGYVDETALASLARSEGGRPVPPFNIGVVLMKRRAIRGLASRLDLLFTLVARFLVWMSRHPREVEGFRPDVRELVRAAAAANPGVRGLAYPAAEYWIVDEVATWLTLGRVPGLTWGFLSPRDVGQNGEFAERSPARGGWTLCHYFTSSTASFFSWVGVREGSGPRAERASGSRRRW